MTRGPRRRRGESQERILDIALEVVSTKRFGATTLIDIAAAVQMTPAGLLHHFGSKERLYVEILRRRDAIDANHVGSPGEGELPGVLILARHNQSVPGLVHLYVNLAAAATEPAHPAHEYFRQRNAQVRQRVARDIAVRQAEGGFAPTADADTVADMLIALLDGLQVRWDVDPTSVNMFDTVAAFWEMAGGRPLASADRMGSAQCAEGEHDHRTMH
ncbi:TetR/AcrR family transcriptional regulator [Microbacterium halotolerans]|uniref:TetR/AcrR family transcriptional regulator n=1 Tax=Microbacterium halotolerans TaxID=246613 RepID=UPI000E6AD7AA|nr:TetR/AcrR family transcriptional regulator [Microbacterium halotolerans]